MTVPATTTPERPMRTYARRARTLRPADVATIIRASLDLIASRAALRRGFGRAIEDLGLVPADRLEPLGDEPPAFDPRTRRAVRVTLRILDLKALGVTCLPRSIVLLKELERNGYRADLVLGKVVEDGAFKAHAWTEVNGVPIDWHEPGASKWTPLARFRTRKAR